MFINFISISVKINDKFINFDVSPVIKDSRVLIPLRYVAENLGAAVNWDDSTKKVTLVKDNKTIILSVNSNEAYIDGNKVSLDASPVIIDGRVLVPVRFIAESLNCSVNWNAQERCVIIYSK